METKYLKYFLGWINTAEGGGKSLTGPAPSFFTVYTARGHARKRKKSFPNKRVIVNNQNTHIFSGSRIPHPEDDVVVFAGFPLPLKKKPRHQVTKK